MPDVKKLTIPRFFNHFLVVFQGFQANILLVFKIFNSITFRVKPIYLSFSEFFETEIHVCKFTSYRGYLLGEFGGSYLNECSLYSLHETSMSAEGNTS